MNKKSFFNMIFFSFLCCLCFFSCQKTENPNDISNLTSQELVSLMSPGWNLGNTLDVCNADRDGDGKINENAKIVNETLWGNPFTTKELFVNLKNDGIKAVRIPVTWRDHLDKNNKIDKEWMNRVQQIVDWALEENLFVIINMHHDGGGDPQFGAWIIEWAYKDYKKFYEHYSSIWKQICSRFKNYDEHLIFESMNEVGFDATTQKKAYTILNKINQDFVNIIRSSGGKNKTRHLLIAGYWTDITATCNEKFSMPKDKQNRCILSVHYYTPWQFCTTNLQKTWGTQKEVAQMDSLIGKLNENFVSKGFPVIIGEYAASGDDSASCEFFIRHLNELCQNYKIATFIWDNGGGIDRKSKDFHWRNPNVLEAMKVN